MRETYTSAEYGYDDYSDYPLQIEADFSHAGSNIRWRENDDERWKNTPFQVGHFKHDPNDAIDGVAEWLSRG